MINVFQPSIGAVELEAVQRVFRSNWVGKGKVTDEFEAAFAKHLGVPRENITSVSCCTEGLFQSIQALGLREGDEVILPTISFVGAANAIAASGAKPVFCDVHPQNLNATVADIEQQLTPRTRAILLLHYGGAPYQLAMIKDLAEKRQIFLIEDAACSVASRSGETACGTFGDIGVWSFDAMKILVCGDGAMVYCKDPAMVKKIASSSYLGMNTSSGLASKAEERWWEFEIDTFGRRAVMNDISSAIGLVQLKRLPQFVSHRKDIAYLYDRELKGLSWLTLPPKVSAQDTSSYYLYHVQLEEGRDKLARFLKEKGIYTTFRYYPLHYVKKYGSTSKLVCAERAAKQTLCIPIHQSLQDEEAHRVVDAIKAFGSTW